MADVQNVGFRAALLARVDGDEAVFSELCDIFLEDAPKRLAAIRAAVQAGDGPALQAAAHAFKGAASVFDATDIVAAARRLELIGLGGCGDDADTVCRDLEARSHMLLDEIRASRDTQPWKS